MDPAQTPAPLGTEDTAAVSETPPAGGPITPPEAGTAPPTAGDDADEREDEPPESAPHAATPTKASPATTKRPEAYPFDFDKCIVEVSMVLYPAAEGQPPDDREVFLSIRDRQSAERVGAPMIHPRVLRLGQIALPPEIALLFDRPRHAMPSRQSAFEAAEAKKLADEAARKAADEKRRQEREAARHKGRKTPNAKAKTPPRAAAKPKAAPKPKPSRQAGFGWDRLPGEEPAATGVPVAPVAPVPDAPPPVGSAPAKAVAAPASPAPAPVAATPKAPAPAEDPRPVKRPAKKAPPAPTAPAPAPASASTDFWD